MLNVLTTGNTWKKFGGAFIASGGTGVPNQTASFGALTLAGAGAFKPIDNNGDVVTLLTYDSLVSGTLGAYTPSINTGGLRFTGAVGAPAGCVLRCSHAGGQVDITIAALVANTYSCATRVQVDSALAAIGSAGGKTISWRRGSYGAQNDLGKFVNYVAEVVMLGEGDCFSGKGTRWNTSYTTFTQNMAFVNIENYTTTSTSCFGSNAFTQGLRISDCWIHGSTHDPFADWSSGYVLPLAGIEAAGNSAGLVIERNLMEYVYNGILCTTAGTMTIQDNECRYMHSDFLQVSADPSDKTSARIIRRNVGYGTLYDAAAHSDFIQMTTTNAPDTDLYENWTIEQNVWFSSPTISLGTMQGLWTGIAGTGNGMRFKNIVVRYNVGLDSHLHACSFYNLDGGTFDNNVFCHHSNSVEPANSVQMNFNLGGTSVGTITVTDNVAEGYNFAAGPTYVNTNNITLGANGGTIAFSTAFDGPTFSAGPTNLANALAKYRAKSGGPVALASAGPLGVGVATFGAARTPAGWSIP